MNNLKRFKVYLYAILLIVIDQIVKICVIKNVKNNPITVIKGILQFTYCENKGMAFSIGNGHVPVFIILNILIIGLIIFFYEKNIKYFNRLGKIFFSMVIAGGMSNLIDRIVRGFVVDFIDITELFQFAIFNVADVFIVLGILGLVLVMIVKERHS